MNHVVNVLIGVLIGLFVIALIRAIGLRGSNKYRRHSQNDRNCAPVDLGWQQWADRWQIADARGRAELMGGCGTATPPLGSRAREIWDQACTAAGSPNIWTQEAINECSNRTRTNHMQRIGVPYMKGQGMHTHNIDGAESAIQS